MAADQELVAAFETWRRSEAGAGPAEDRLARVIAAFVAGRLQSARIDASSHDAQVAVWEKVHLVLRGLRHQLQAHAGTINVLAYVKGATTQEQLLASLLRSRHGGRRWRTAATELGSEDVERVHAVVPRPDAIVDELEAAARVEAIIAELPPGQRWVAHEHFVQGRGIATLVEERLAAERADARGHGVVWDAAAEERLRNQLRARSDSALRHARAKIRRGLTSGEAG